MQSILEFLYLIKEFLNPKFIIDTMLDKLGVFVYFGLFFIIFAETGLAVGFFLPGDSLLVVAGLFAAAGKMNIFVLLISLFIAGILGDLVGYLTGRRMGKTIFNRPKSRVFNPNHLIKAQKFYEKYGGKTIILARFVPIVRTFAPIVAGAAEMPYRSFAFYNILGSFLWIFSMLLTGYFLGGLVEQLAQSLFGIPDFKLEDHIDKVVIVVVLLSILPIIIEYIKARRERKHSQTEIPAET
ncbi:MAG: VTT domain-containing protein [Acidobacteriota bacterium]|nr:VTT domain-containing protein [Acidobacteriota bacterium]